MKPTVIQVCVHNLCMVYHIFHVVSATNPRSIALTMHRRKIKIAAPIQDKLQETKRFIEPISRSEGPRPSQKSKMSSRERPPLSGRRVQQGVRPP